MGLLIFISDVLVAYAFNKKTKKQNKKEEKQYS